MSHFNPTKYIFLKYSLNIDTILHIINQLISIFNRSLHKVTLLKILIEKLDIDARTCYRIMLGIKQCRDYVTNQILYQLTEKVPFREKFTGCCLRMPTDEPANRFVILNQGSDHLFD